MTTQDGNFRTTIDPPQVRIPLSLEGQPEAKWYQGQATVLYQIWDALRKLGTSNSTLINNDDLTESFIVACSDETTALTTGTQKAVFQAPYDCELIDLTASLTTAATGTTKLTIDVGLNGTSILPTKLTFDSGEKTTRTASVPVAVTTTDIAQDDEIRIDITSVGSTIAGAGLKVTFRLRQVV